MARQQWLDLLADQADLPALEAHRVALLAAGAQESVVDAEARAAVEIAVLLQERRHRAVELAALNDIAGRLASVADPGELLVEVVDQARRLLGVDLTYVVLIAEDDLEIRVASGDRSAHLVGVRLPSSAGLVGAVLEAGAPRWTSDYAADETLVHEPRADRAAAAESIRGLLGVPLSVRGQVLGVLLAAKREERRFGQHEISLLTALAAHAAVALDNASRAQELRDARDGLAATLRLDAELTAAVLAGGDPDSLVERVRAMTDAPVRWFAHPGAGPIGAALARAGESGDPGRIRVGDALVQPVLAAGTLFGALVVDDTEPGAPGSAAPAVDAALLVERAAPLIALTLAGARATARAVQLGRDIATIDLLSRSEEDPAAESRRWWGAGLDPRRAHLVVVAGGDPERARRFVAGLRLGERVASAVHRGQLVLVVPADLDLSLRWGGEEAPAAGLAGPVLEPAGLRAAHAEASRTARVMTTLGRTAVLARAADLGVFAVLLSRTGRQELRDQTARELGPVLAEEAARGVPLLRTLEVFLDQGRRPTATAAALRVHVNTVYQRLAALDRLLGREWRGRALELQVLLRLRRAAEDLDDA
ncbi:MULTISPECIES: GAF domain-containing protein [unclassified Rathayibacter]|uniref:helix-turn-helix domain-containing protein n=1 Tax=unclassified Rathayibacter TaxID=2609250 RepID=UPI000F4B10CD|nr:MULTISPECIES: GAF domain-containing protein [unclassified Rathayibacter]ROP45116.1 GAF domain-containing protein [Rathayibacter sp. PhB186]ROS47847.1 GAF domain-containing protein [Rathayibacter sp. PhB185]